MYMTRKILTSFHDVIVSVSQHTVISWQAWLDSSPHKPSTYTWAPPSGAWRRLWPTLTTCWPAGSSSSSNSSSLSWLPCSLSRGLGWSWTRPLSRSKSPPSRRLWYVHDIENFQDDIKDVLSEKSLNLSYKSIFTHINVIMSFIKFVNVSSFYFSSNFNNGCDTFFIFINVFLQFIYMTLKNHSDEYPKMEI